MGTDEPNSQPNRNPDSGISTTFLVQYKEREAQVETHQEIDAITSRVVKRGHFTAQLVFGLGIALAVLVTVSLYMVLPSGTFNWVTVTVSVGGLAVMISSFVQFVSIQRANEKIQDQVVQGELQAFHSWASAALDEYRSEDTDPSIEPNFVTNDDFASDDDDDHRRGR